MMWLRSHNWKHIYACWPAVKSLRSTRQWGQRIRCFPLKQLDQRCSHTAVTTLIRSQGHNLKPGRMDPQLLWLCVISWSQKPASSQTNADPSVWSQSLWFFSPCVIVQKREMRNVALAMQTLLPAVCFSVFVSLFFLITQHQRLTSEKLVCLNESKLLQLSSKIWQKDWNRRSRGCKNSTLVLRFGGYQTVLQFPHTFAHEVCWTFSWSLSLVLPTCV